MVPGTREILKYGALLLVSARSRTSKPGPEMTAPIPVPLQTETVPASASAAKPALARSAAIVAIAFVVSRVLGLFREVIVAYHFGTGGISDAYVAAFRIPDLLFLVIMAGSFGSAFVPVFAGFMGRGDEDRAWRLASAVLTWSVLIVASMAVLIFLLAGPLVRYVVVPGLAPEFQSTTINLMRLLLLSPILLGLGIASKGILEAQDRYVLPALAPLVYNLSIIAGGLFLVPYFGIYALGIGVVVGAACHFAVQMPGLLRSGIRFSPTLDRTTEGLGAVWRLLLPRVLGQAAFQINFIVVTFFASSVSNGAAAALNFAWQLLMLPHGVLALSISTVIFPSMSRLYEQGRLDELRAMFFQAMRPLFFLTVPASIGLFTFREPIIRVTLRFGSFDERSVQLVASAVAYFALGLVFYAFVEVLTRVFYAMRDTKTPVIAGLSTIALNIVLCAVLVGPLGIAGLALSLSLTTAFEGVILAAVLMIRLGFRDAGLGFWLFRLLLAAGVIAVVVAGLSGPLDDVTRGDSSSALVRTIFLLAAMGIAGVAYGIGALLAGLPEAERVVALVQQRAGRLLPDRHRG